MTPWTAGVFNYCDQGDQRKEVKVKKATKYEAGQEYEANEEEEAKFVKFLGKGGSQLLLEAEKSFASSSKGKPALTKGVGKSGAKGKLAIKDGRAEEEEPEEKSEAAQMADAIRKTQRCKEQLVVGISNMEEAILAATTNGRLTTKCKKEHEMLVKDCSVWLEKLKSLISKKAEGKTLEEVKELLAKAAAKVKEVKDEAKELQQTANKAVSKATTKAKKWKNKVWTKSWEKGGVEGLCQKVSKDFVKRSARTLSKGQQGLCQKVSNAFVKKGHAWATMAPLTFDKKGFLHVQNTVQLTCQNVSGSLGTDPGK